MYASFTKSSKLAIAVSTALKVLFIILLKLLMFISNVITLTKLI